MLKFWGWIIVCTDVGPIMGNVFIHSLKITHSPFSHVSSSLNFCVQTYHLEGWRVYVSHQRPDSPMFFSALVNISGQMICETFINMHSTLFSFDYYVLLTLCKHSFLFDIFFLVFLFNTYFFDGVQFNALPIRLAAFLRTISETHLKWRIVHESSRMLGDIFKFQWMKWNCLSGICHIAILHIACRFSGAILYPVWLIVLLCTTDDFAWNDHFLLYETKLCFPNVWNLAQNIYQFCSGFDSNVQVFHTEPECCLDFFYQRRDDEGKHSDTFLSQLHIQKRQRIVLAQLSGWHHKT